MAQTDALKKYLDAGMAFTSLTRARAEQVVKDLVKAGELQRGQAKDTIDDLVERSRKNSETLAEQVRKEVDSHLANLGLARKADLDRLEAKLAEMTGAGGPAATGDADPAPAKAPAKKAAPPKKAPAKAASAAKVPSAPGTPAKKAAAKTTASAPKPAQPKKAAKVGGPPAKTTAKKRA